MIDSRDRNNVKYPSPNGISNYRIDLNQTYRKCCKIELVYAFIPDSQYVINSGNNILTISKPIDDKVPEKTEVVDIEIPKGDYNVISEGGLNNLQHDDKEKYQDALSKAITSKVSSIDGLTSFKCNYLPLTDNYVINLPKKYQFNIQGR